MTNHFFMGAINKLTNKYEYPKIADKKNLYKCPECNNNVIFKKGEIKQPHFSHKKSNCTYYKRPSETQIHLNAKMLMKTLLDNKTPISFYRNCNYCNEKYNMLNVDVYEDNCEAIIEYKFNYNESRKSADVALIENNNIKYIFEICHTNKTKVENRPEPWVEIDAETLINNMNQEQINNEIECIRYHKCERCISYELEQIQRNKEFVELTNMRNEEMIQRKYELDEKNRKKLLEKERQMLERKKRKNEEDERIKKKNERIKKEYEEKKQNDELLERQRKEKEIIEKTQTKQEYFSMMEYKNLICNCGKPAIRKKNKNLNKIYFECRNKPCDKCDFIKWINEPCEDIDI
jgi:hypothetical protein